MSVAAFEHDTEKEATSGQLRPAFLHRLPDLPPLGGKVGFLVCFSKKPSNVRGKSEALLPGSHCPLRTHKSTGLECVLTQTLQHTSLVQAEGPAARPDSWRAASWRCSRC